MMASLEYSIDLSRLNVTALDINKVNTPIDNIGIYENCTHILPS